jgi:hypothetical protein
MVFVWFNAIVVRGVVVIVRRGVVVVVRVVRGVVVPDDRNKCRRGSGYVQLSNSSSLNKSVKGMRLRG